MKKQIAAFVLVLILLVSPAMSQNASYLDSVYQTLEVATGTDALTALKNSINEKFNVVIAEDEGENQNTWNLNYVQAIKEVFEAVPASFSMYTRMVFLDP
ncbi:MAG TPA: hypothetical protein PLK58_16485, partial [Candidatus Rifleibacterium sp.]|nr:hypothetical protein [Candidatus Rifleibacterium sp.]